MLQVLAAGSLRKVWQALMADFSAETGIAVASRFAPAGLLRQRIEQGEHCDFFASANLTHPQTLLDARAEPLARYLLTPEAQLRLKQFNFIAADARSNTLTNE